MKFNYKSQQSPLDSITSSTFISKWKAQKPSERALKPRVVILEVLKNFWFFFTREKKFITTYDKGY